MSTHNEFNQIRLIKGYGIYTPQEYTKFSKYETVTEDNVEELDRWLIDNEDKALETLNQYNNTYHKAARLHYITEYALEYYRADENGDFIDGSIYVFAKDEEIEEDEENE